MWKKMIVLGGLLLFIVLEAQAARCKVDGKWYSYDSPQCNPNRQSSREIESSPEDPVSDSVPFKHPVNEALVNSSGTNPALISSYLRPWAEVAYLAEQHCRDPRPQIGGPACLIWEERGYWAMHGNFAMPEHIAAHSKTICTAKTSSFRSQATCMQNESIGYMQFIADSDMPDTQAKAARTECEQKLSSWSQRGSCMTSAIYRFMHPNGRNKSRAVMSASFSGYIEGPPGYAKESEVRTLRVVPRDDQKSHATGVSRTLPGPMNIRKRAARLAPESAKPDVLTQAINELETNADYNVLNAAVPQVEGIASLAYSWPATVHPRFGVTFTENENSVLGMMLEVEAGRVYLLDFVVWAAEQGSYIVTNGSQKHIYEDVGAAIRNVTVRLIAEKTGTTGLSLRHQYGKGFTFHALAITSIEATRLFAPESEAR